METSKKMYKNCPYKDYGFMSCRECPKYGRCARRKRAQIIKRCRRKFLSQLIVGTTVFLVCAVVLSITLWIISSITLFASGTQIEGVEAVAEAKEEIIREIQKESSNEIEPREEKKQRENEIKKVSKPKEELALNEDVQVGIETVTIVPVEATFTSTVEIIVKTEELPTVNAFSANKNYVYNLSYEDMVFIAKVVWAEARGESLEGKVAVAAVILNRYFSGLSLFETDSIYSVVTQANQFASIKNVTMEDLKEYPECMEAVEMACKGWDPTRAVFESGALYFYNPDGISGYQARIREGITVMTIGRHNFHVDFNPDAGK